VSTCTIERLRCPRDVKDRLRTVGARLLALLGDGLVGAYLYGSLPRGCFHPAVSDIDAIVVTRSTCEEAVIARMREHAEETNLLVDATFVAFAQANVDRTPTPVDFTLKPIGGARTVRPSGGLPDFLLQRQDAYECDAPLVGSAAREILRPVPWPALSECLDAMLPQILPRFKNPALMLCRWAFAFANRRIGSKREAGEWALEAFDQAWRPLIQEALHKYAAGVPDDRGPDEPLRALEAYCLQYTGRAP